MFLCIETKDDVKLLSDTLKSGTALFYYLFEPNYHPVSKRVCVVFIYHLETDSLFLISFSHPDVVLMDKNILNYINNSNCKKYILNKKDSMYVSDVSSYIDISFEMYCKTGNLFEYKLPLNNSDIRSMPIMLIKKSFNDTLKLLKPYLNTHENCNFSSDLCKAFYEIEKNGVYINREVYNLGSTDLIHDNGCVYTQYNYFTPTTRPSNRFGKINFAALNSKKNEKDSIESRFGEDGVLFMVDYESYHLRLFADYINFSLPESSLHEYFGKFYYDKEELTEEEYEMSKKITFNLIYGGISDDVKEHIPFMAEVVKYVESSWTSFNKNGYIETWLYNRKLYKENYDSMNSYKLFNYLLQSAETERNTKLALYLNSEFSNLKSKVILYHYDAFIVDLHKSEISHTKKIIENLTDNNKFPLRVYIGKNYGDMSKLSVC